MHEIAGMPQTNDAVCHFGGVVGATYHDAVAAHPDVPFGLVRPGRFTSTERCCAEREMAAWQLTALVPCSVLVWPLLYVLPASLDAASLYAFAERLRVPCLHSEVTCSGQA